LSLQLGRGVKVNKITKFYQIDLKLALAAKDIELKRQFQAKKIL